MNEEDVKEKLLLALAKSADTVDADASLKFAQAYVTVAGNESRRRYDEAAIASINRPSPFDAMLSLPPKEAQS